jgi:putative acetyltransferase
MIEVQAVRDINRRSYMQDNSTSHLIIRHAKPDDLDAILQLFADTISAICSNDYSAEQIAVWTSSVNDPGRWIDRIASQFFLVSELDHKIIGYASLQNGDYVDLLYVHKDYQRQGVAAMLYKEIEREASRRGVRTLYSDVSKTACTFFVKMGFAMHEEQVIARQGVEIANFRMSKVV